jgi:hypothetical protein
MVLPFRAINTEAYPSSFFLVFSSNPHVSNDVNYASWTSPDSWPEAGPSLILKCELHEAKLHVSHVLSIDVLQEKVVVNRPFCVTLEVVPANADAFEQVASGWTAAYVNKVIGIHGPGINVHASQACPNATPDRKALLESQGKKCSKCK